MAYTKAKYRSEVIDLGATYGIEIRLGSKLIDRAVQFSIDEFYRRMVSKRPQIWEKTKTVTDDFLLGADFISIVDVYYTVSGTRIGFRYSPLPEWAGMKKNSAALAETNDPAYTIWDHKIWTWPASLTGISMVYNAKPTQLYILGAQPADSTLSDIPEDGDGIVVRGAFERVLVMMVDEKEAMGITQGSLERIQKANFEYYAENLQRMIEGAPDATIR